MSLILTNKDSYRQIDRAKFVSLMKTGYKYSHQKYDNKGNPQIFFNKNLSWLCFSPYLLEAPETELFIYFEQI
jgi:hypothetical protein